MPTLTRRGAVGVLTLDRPPANAIDAETLTALQGLRGEIASDPSIRAVVVVGSSRIFSGGVDIGMIRDLLSHEDGQDRMLAFIRRIQQFHTDWRALPVPTVAAVAGSATGGGLELALACDLRVAAREARLGLTEVRIGLVPGAGGTQMLTRLAGPATAARLILTGELVTGAEAERLGIVHTAVAAEEVSPTAFAWAEELASRSASALREIKRCLALAPSDEGYAAEISGSARLLSEPATVELVSSFFSRRAPSQSGRS